MFYDTLTAHFSACVPPLTSRVSLIMVIGGFRPFHRLWPGDALTKQAGIIPTPWAMMPTLGFKSYHWGDELLVAPPPMRICPFYFLGE